MINGSFLSIVVPAYNEETNIGPFYEAMTRVLDGLDLRAEIIFVDDGSSDRTYELIARLAERDPRVKAVRFSRNFGSHAALLAGLRAARGDAAVMISVDLQDPPDLIPAMVEQWRAGAHVVWAVREGRDEPWATKAFSALFYQVFRRIALKDYPAGGMDFGLFDRAVLDHLRRMDELNHFLTGVIVWLGFRQTRIFYRRRARRSGTSKWNMGKRVKAALDAIVSFSYVPIRAISYAGLLVSFASLAYGVYVLVARMFDASLIPGWASVMAAVLFLGGLQLTMLGILGEYVWRGTEQAKSRPQYIVMDAIGLDAPPLEYAQPLAFTHPVGTGR